MYRVSNFPTLASFFLLQVYCKDLIVLPCLNKVILNDMLQYDRYDTIR